MYTHKRFLTSGLVFRTSLPSARALTSDLQAFRECQEKVAILREITHRSRFKNLHQKSKHYFAMLNNPPNSLLLRFRLTIQIIFK